MPSDLATLAEAFGVGLPEVQACLLVADDGALAVAHPADEQMRALAAWNGVRGLGDVRRGSISLGRDCWAFVMRAHSGALALTAPTPRLAVVLDRLDEVLDRAASRLEGTETIALVREFAGLLGDDDHGASRSSEPRDAMGGAR
jgi:hypothetical protein